MNLDGLQQALNYAFRNIALLRQALTHRSAHAFNNERLEFLGDSVLNFAVADILYHRFNGVSEGNLSRMRAHLVREETLALLAQGLALGDLLTLGQGERRSGGARRASILADAFEAVLGAIYLDSGFIEAQAVIQALLADYLTDQFSQEQLKDAKTQLQEYLQGRGQPLPQYELAEEAGEAHSKRFIARCNVAGVASVQAEASSRRKAEQAAAQLMLLQLEALP